MHLLNSTMIKFKGDFTRHHQRVSTTSAICFYLSPSQMIATFQCNILQHWAQHVVYVWPPYCNMLRHIECFGVNWKWSNFWCNICRCCIRACALVRFSTCNIPQHVATWWPNAHNMLQPTMLQYVWSKFCDRLAGALDKRKWLKWCYSVWLCQFSNFVREKIL